MLSIVLAASAAILIESSSRNFFLAALLAVTAGFGGVAVFFGAVGALGVIFFGAAA
jgi:hypothetical protein